MSARIHRCRQPLKHICAASTTLKEFGVFLGASLLFLFDLMVLVSGFVQRFPFKKGKDRLYMEPAKWPCCLQAGEQLWFSLLTYLNGFQPAEIQHDCTLEAVNRGALLLHPPWWICLYLEHLFETGSTLKFLELKPSYSSKTAGGF